MRDHSIAGGHRLVVGPASAERVTLSAIAMAGWVGSPPILSRSATGDRQAVLAAAADRVGLDMETLARITANARADDGWLSAAEQAIVREARSPSLEIACRWMLKEAYGKALGVGLALPLAALTFRGEGGAILLTGAAAPPASDGWAFLLLRCGEALFAVASSSSGDPVRTAGKESAAAAA